MGGEDTGKAWSEDEKKYEKNMKSEFEKILRIQRMQVLKKLDKQDVKWEIKVWRNYRERKCVVEASGREEKRRTVEGGRGTEVREEEGWGGGTEEMREKCRGWG